MTPFLYPDNPIPISLDYLKRIDADPPGTWLASVKYDGWRRFATKHDGRWTWRAKPSGSGALKAMPAELQAEFESVGWPDGITLDMEWVGTRMVEHKPEHTLMVFDVVGIDGKLCGWPFWKRHNFIETFAALGSKWNIPHVQFVTCHPNPGIVDMFTEQLTNPLSEGVVIRRADSTIIGSPSRCVGHPHVLKCKYRNIRELKGGK